YRSPLNYSNEHLDEAAVALTRLYTSLRGIDAGEFVVDTDYEARFNEAMNDDFNTPVALSVLFDMARELNKVKDSDKQRSSQLAATIRALGGILGILQDDAERFLKEGDNQVEGLTAEQIETLIQARIDAKKNKNWAEADDIRDQLKQQGVILEDIPGGGTNWRRE
ncbi:MAG TPA: cysteine--tRNA ligase, partial [Methylococcaceae bacterium]|nr:cysteine--tRNA ligase [Methylococcaceae bacterium]